MCVLVCAYKLRWCRRFVEDFKDPSFPIPGSRAVGDSVNNGLKLLSYVRSPDLHVSVRPPTSLSRIRSLTENFLSGSSLRTFHVVFIIGDHLSFRLDRWPSMNRYLPRWQCGVPVRFFLFVAQSDQLWASCY